MQFHKLYLEEKGKLATLIHKQFLTLNFSNLTQVAENNLSDPRWMDVYILIYKCNLAPDIQAYDILLKKLSAPMMKFCYTVDGNDYAVDANPVLMRLYLWYLISGEAVNYSAKAQYIPAREYIKELFRFYQFNQSGIYLENIDKDKFRIAPTEYEFDNLDDAMIWYNKFLDAYDVFRSLKLPKENFIQNINLAFEYGKDKRFLATVSNMLSYFDLQFILQDGGVALKDSEWKMTNEKEAERFQVKLIDAYQFFRNVVNTKEKKDIVSEIYNRKLSMDIREQFEENVQKYLNVLKNQELIDWIITISKESKYTLPISFNDEGIFTIEETTISNPAEAKEFYIDYMDNKKEKLAMAIYKNNIINRIKHIWNKLRAKFAKI